MKSWIIVSLLIVILSACAHSDDWTLVVRSQEDGAVYYRVDDVESGEKFTIEWIHSVEKTPWRETYQITDEGDLMLIETAFQSFGAGVPHQKGTMTVEDGEVIVRDIHERLPVFRWIHSQTVDFHLHYNNKLIFDAEDLPHHERMEILIEKG